METIEFIALSDAELLTACRNGDEGAWETLVQRFQRLIYAIPRRSGLDDTAAAEIFQRTFVRLFENLGRIKQPDRLAAWLVTTAKRETWRMSQAERATIPIPGVDEEGAEQSELPDNSPLPGEILLELEQQHVVRTALAALDKRCQTLLRLLYFSAEIPGYAEIAASLDIKEGSIGPTRARCLEKLRKFLLEADV